MKLLITENQKDKLKTKILDSFEKNGVYKTFETYSLTPKTLDFIFKNDFPKFDCYDLSQLHRYFYGKKYFDHNFTFYFDNKLSCSNLFKFIIFISCLFDINSVYFLKIKSYLY